MNFHDSQKIYKTKTNKQTKKIDHPIHYTAPLNLDVPLSVVAGSLVLSFLSISLFSFCAM
ncbi:hypothetical protein C0J52_06277 [Blattella germanica]|nr:hypothetical protein C0J52_06277 [Blattella germanica]